ncbi:MAG: TrmB family transcriptional regulator [Candidatus Bathyarchaeia archaeon]|jgi:sugar-specific transcriptional regulator TrmB
MQDKLVAKLVSFGFTTNQAKVYLNIVQSGKTHVGKISKETQLHRQDIYKLLPKIEQMGLIVRTIDKPFMIEALPLQNALKHLIQKEKDDAAQRISFLERNLRDLTNLIRQQKKHEGKEEARFTLLTTSEALQSKGSQTFKKKRKSINIVTNTENLMGASAQHYKELLRLIVESKAKIHLVIVSTKPIDELKQTIEKVMPENGFFTVKVIEKCACKDYQLIDNKEVWIVTQQKSEAGHPTILWTNDPNLVEVYSENFVQTWSCPSALTIYKQKSNREAAIKKKEQTTPKLLV